MNVGIKVVANVYGKKFDTTMYTEGNIKAKVYNKQERFIKVLSKELTARHMYPQSIEVFKLNDGEEMYVSDSDASKYRDIGSWYGVCDVTRRVAYEF